MVKEVEVKMGVEGWAIIGGSGDGKDGGGGAGTSVCFLRIRTQEGGV